MTESVPRRHLVEAVPDAAFDLHAIAGAFPDTADTLLLDQRLTDEDEASARVFRIYRPVPPHDHTACDEYLIVMSGRARFFMDGGEPFEVHPGPMLFFKRNVIHGMVEIVEHPLFMVSIDTPRRDSEIVKVDH